MAITDSLSNVWHGLEDKAWGLADFLEGKGIPIASFCESKGVSPLLLFGGILIAILILIVLVSGGGAAGGNATLTVYLKDDAGSPVKAMFTIKIGTISDGYDTDLNGKKVIGELPYGHGTITVQTSRYTGSESFDITSDSSMVTVTVRAIKGTIRVIAKDTAGNYLKNGTVEIRQLTGGNLIGSSALNGADKYDFTVPVNQYNVIIKSMSGGELKKEIVDVKDDGVYEKTFSIDAAAANSGAVRVLVTDETGSPLPNAYVMLYNSRNDAAIGGQQITGADGATTFSPIAMGTSVYPVVYMANDRRYGQLNAQESKNLYKITVQSIDAVITVELPLNGRVEVSVWDKESKAAISGALVKIKSKAGEVVSEEKTTNSEGKATFAGFEENLEVYPAITSIGFLNYENSQDARPITYSGGGTVRFSVGIERDGSFIASIINVSVFDVYGDPIKGVNAILSEIGAGFTKALTNADNISFEVDANKLYNVALYKQGLLRKVLEGLGPGSQTVQMEASNTANAADVRVCTFMNINSILSEATSRIELYLSTGALIDLADTIGGSDGDNCATFKDIPREWMVYARATNDGYSPMESEVVQLKPRQELDLNMINLTFNSLPANAAVAGAVKVCAKDATNDAVAGAEILLYDYDMDAPSWVGEYRKGTASDGCVIFDGIPSEKTDYEGVLVPVTVYPIVSATGYATFNGKAEGLYVQVQPERTTPLDVQLTTGKTVCISVMNGETPLSGVNVSLCANGQCSQMIETVNTESDGHAMFSTDVTAVTVKVVANIDSIVKESTKTFPYAQVSEGQCGEVDMATVTQYATVTFDGISTMLLEVEPDTSNEISFVVRINSQLATGGALPTGGQNKVLGADGTEVLIGTTGDITPGIVRTADAAAGSYALPFIAPSAEGDYQMTLAASIPSCSTCQGDQRTLTIQVGDGDSDNDGILDEYDQCPNTASGVAVDSYGCPTVSSTDSDGDGVNDDADDCPGTASGVQVLANGCPASTVVDTDGDGVADRVDAYPTDSSRWYDDTSSAMEDNSIAQQYGEQGYQNSVQICVVDEQNAPVYDSSIIVYGMNTGYGSSAYGSGSAGYGTGYGSTGYGSAGYGTGYGTGYGAGYGSAGMGYNQPWQAVQSRDNCRVFMGYSSMQNLYLDSFLTSFYLNVEANGYEPYDSKNSSRTNVRLAMGSGGMGSFFTLEVVLKRKIGGKMGQGSVADPARQVELVSASWKAQDPEKKDSTNVYPLVTTLSKDINLRVKYTVSTPATDTTEYEVKYTISGNKCYKTEDSSASALGGRSITFTRGQTSVDDELTLYTDDNCLTSNDQALESAFTLNMEGKILQVGDREAKASSRFTPIRVNMKPVVGATKKVSGISGMTQLSGMMELQYGVVTTGQAPYCIDPKWNTDKSSMVSSRGIADRTAADKKIVLEFKGTNVFPTTLDSLAAQINDYIRGRVRKAPLDCKAYITSDGKYMGHFEVGQKGFACHDAKVQVEGGKQVDPWEKLFCDMVKSGSAAQVQLGGSYAMRVESK